MRITLTARQVVHEIRKQVPVTEGTGFTTVRDGAEMITYELTCYPDELDAMAKVAARNKNSIAQRGPFRVKVLDRKRI